MAEEAFCSGKPESTRHKSPGDSMAGMEIRNEVIHAEDTAWGEELYFKQGQKKAGVSSGKLQRCDSRVWHSWEEGQILFYSQ